MFEREIKFIYDFNLNKISRLGPYFTYEQLTTTEIHPAILHYISAEIDYLVFEDRQNLLKKSVFDYSGEKISYHFTQITEELKKSKRFATEYIAKLILHASSFTVNFLIRPKWALTRFVFDEEKHKTSNEIKQILNYVYYYKYLTKILISYINTKKILSMNVEEFEALLNKADSVGIDNYLPAILSDSLKSMAEFFNIGEVKKNRIPLPAVEMFLEEKELLNHVKVLNETFGGDENARFNLADYNKVLSRVMLQREEVPPIVEHEEEFETSEIEAAEPIKEMIHEKEEVINDELEKDEEVEEVKEFAESIEEDELEERLIEDESIENEVEIHGESEIVPEEESFAEEQVAQESEEDFEEEDVVNEEPELNLYEKPYHEEYDIEAKSVIAEEPIMEEFENDEEEAAEEQEVNLKEEDEEKISEFVDQEETNVVGLKPESIEPEDELLFNNLFSNASHEETTEHEKSEHIDTEEEVASQKAEDVVLKTPKKFRIHIKDESKIEPIYDEDDSETGLKVDLFKDYGSFTETTDESEKVDENIFGEEEPEKVTFFSKEDFEEETIEEEAIEEEAIQQQDTNEMVSDDEESVTDVEQEIIISLPEKAEPNNVELEKSVEHEEEELEQNDFQKIMEEQQTIYNSLEPDESEDKMHLEDYESDASKKLDERIAVDKESAKDESSFDLLKQNFIEGKEALPKVDLAEILERKEMAKIIEVIFDYDIEDFAGILDEISDCKNVDDAHLVINQSLEERHINLNSKEAESFREIIKEYFEKGK